MRKDFMYLKLPACMVANNDKDSQWQILGDEVGGSNRNSSESLKINPYAISHTIEVRQSTQKADLAVNDVGNPEVRTAIYGNENKRW